jgi:predicted outer membrane repeat protein
MLKTTNLLIIMVFLLVLLGIGSTSAVELYVPGDYSTIQAAIDASINGDTIFVADGTYTGEGNHDIDFKGRSITIKSENGPENCIINCQALGRGFYFYSAENEASVINGFTITNGQGTGAGIYCRDDSSPTIENCVFSLNNAGTEGGGAIDSAYGASPIIKNCLFIGNTAKYGAAINSSYGTIKIDNCVFIGNSGQYCGGLRTHHCTTIVKYCTFLSNSAESGGGLQVIYTDLNLSNCTLYGNSADTYGGGISVSVDSNAVLKNCIFWLNTAVEGAAIANKFFSSAPYPSTVSVFYNDIQGGQSNVYVSPQCTLNWGPGNIDADPYFVNPDANDFHLKSQGGRWTAQGWVTDMMTSPCIDAGDPDSPIGLEPFPNGGRVNIGTYGGTEQASKSYFGTTPCQTIMAGDINGDCKINFMDFVILADHWLWQE